MMKNIKLLLMLFCVLMLVTAHNAEAKWWIFGQESEPVTIDYLYANAHNFDDFEKGITLYKYALENGLIHIKGKATAEKGKIGKVLVSINGMNDWGKAKIANDGSFDFSYTPEDTIVYDIYVKAIDTTGRSNDIEITHRTINISDQDVEALIDQTLNYLQKAYESKDSTAFMSHVSEDYAGDDVALASAIRKDFSLLDDITLNFSVNSTASQNGRFYVSITYNRRVTVMKTGEVLSDNGITEFDFTQGHNGLMLYSMKVPLIFGLSDAENVATGSVNSVENNQVIIINSRGDPRKVSMPEAINSTTSNSGTANVTNGTFTLAYNELYSGQVSKGFIFADGTTVDVSDPLSHAPGVSDIYLESNIFWPDTGALIQDLGVDGSGSIDFSHMSAPVSGYAASPVGAVANDDHVYAIKLPNNTYGLIKNISSSLTTTPPAYVHSNITCQYKYRDDGGRDF